MFIRTGRASFSKWGTRGKSDILSTEGGCQEELRCADLGVRMSKQGEQLVCAEKTDIGPTTILPWDLVLVPGASYKYLARESLASILLESIL